MLGRGQVALVLRTSWWSWLAYVSRGYGVQDVLSFFVVMLSNLPNLPNLLCLQNLLNPDLPKSPSGWYLPLVWETLHSKSVRDLGPTLIGQLLAGSL